MGKTGSWVCKTSLDTALAQAHSAYLSYIILGPPIQNIRAQVSAILYNLQLQHIKHFLEGHDIIPNHGCYATPFRNMWKINTFLPCTYYDNSLIHNHGTTNTAKCLYKNSLHHFLASQRKSGSSKSQPRGFLDFPVLIILIWQP